MPNQELQHLGYCIKEARKCNGFSQQALADMSSMSMKYLANIEKGVANPSFVVLRGILKILNLSADRVFFAEKEDDNDLQHQMTMLFSMCSPEQQELIFDVAKCISSKGYRNLRVEGLEK